MAAILQDLSVVEVSAFVAAPIGGMTLAQLGADVVRIDPIGGNIDYRRWPLAPDGTSLYWTALNKAKRSVALALNKPEGQEIARALICAPGEGRGILLTNLPASGWMGHAALAEARPDLISLRLLGNSDGSGAVDYTVNCAVGFPTATGRGGEPVNHVLPAWDVAAGLYLATGLLAAERARRRDGRGQEITLALSDVALATVANLGYVADVQVNGAVRPPMGNDLYGAFGRDFPTADGRRVMLVAISNRQWRAIGKATGLGEKLAMIGPMLDVDLDDEGGRFEARHAIAAVLAPWFARRTLARDRPVVRRQRYPLGAVPGFRAARAGGPALLDRQPHLRGGGPARRRARAGAGGAAVLLRRPPPRAPARAAPRRAQRRGAGGGAGPVGRGDRQAARFRRGGRARRREVRKGAPR